jgi:hypothetical protein
VKLTKKRLRRMILEEMGTYLIEQDDAGITAKSKEVVDAMKQRILDMGEKVRSTVTGDRNAMIAKAKTLLKAKEDGELALTSDQEAQLNSIAGETPEATS